GRPPRVYRTYSPLDPSAAARYRTGVTDRGGAPNARHHHHHRPADPRPRWPRVDRPQRPAADLPQQLVQVGRAGYLVVQGVGLHQLRHPQRRADQQPQGRHADGRPGLVRRRGRRAAAHHPPSRGERPYRVCRRHADRQPDRRNPSGWGAGADRRAGRAGAGRLDPDRAPVGRDRQDHRPQEHSRALDHHPLNQAAERDGPPPPSGGGLLGGFSMSYIAHVIAEADGLGDPEVVVMTQADEVGAAAPIVSYPIPPGSDPGEVLTEAGWRVLSLAATEPYHLYEVEPTDWV